VAVVTVERILDLGAGFNWPALRLNPGETLAAGERAWRRYLAHLTAAEHGRLVVALEAGWAAAAHHRGMVRP
jgi:hypothetical protein